MVPYLLHHHCSGKMHDLLVFIWPIHLIPAKKVPRNQQKKQLLQRQTACLADSLNIQESNFENDYCKSLFQCKNVPSHMRRRKVRVGLVIHYSDFTVK